MILWILLVLKYIGCESNLNQCQDENCSIIQQTLRSPGNRSSQYYSEQQVCDLLDAALLFGQTDDLVILTENGHYTKELYTQQCVQRTPHRIWLIPKLIQKEYFENNIKKWLRDGIQKFVILCSLESTSLLLELTKGLLISGLEPLFFITSRQPMYFLGSLPSMVVAVEDGNNENSGDPTEKNFDFYIHDAIYHKWRTINYHDLMHQHYTSLELRDLIESYPLSSFVQENYQLQLRVVTVVEEPYMMIANFSNVFEDGSCVVGKICWKPNNKGPYCCIGYLIDMLESLEEDLMFQSYLYFVADGKYGEIVNGSWVGMVGDLVKGKADLALASLTINTKRSEAVSYSLPFLVGGMILISILEEKALPFANLEPFKAIALDLWIGVIVVPSCTVLIIVITDRIGAGKQYALRESFTYIMGLLFQRDMGGKNPISWSSKVIALSVAMFTLVVMSTYTALLTANSVTFTRSLGISGFDDPKIKNPTREFRYGTVANSAYTQLFANSQDPVWNRMAQFMKDYNFTNTSKAFEQLATGELQAIIHDYFIAYHNIAKDTNCRFKFAGESIKDGGSGLAVQKGSKLANQISTLILKYQDQEFFLQLQQKWMENKCVETSKGSSPGATNNNNVVVRIGKEYFGGVFIALCGVTLISFGILVVEYLLNRKIHTRTYWVSERRRKRWRRY